MHPLQRWWIKRSMQLVLLVSAALAKRSERLSLALMRRLARMTIARKKIHAVSQGQELQDLQALGANWQRGFASAKQVPIREIKEGTVFAEIHTPCPLRGSGDTQACWRMMAYDREIAQAANGQFVVLRSQAEPGVQVCQVALRPAGVSMDDLQQAHMRP